MTLSTKPEDVSGNAIFQRAIGQPSLLRRWAIVTDNLAEGLSPRSQLDFLKPEKSFSVERRGGRLIINPESYHRYDAFADCVASIDVPRLVAVYRAMREQIEQAYRALGYPGATIDSVSIRALRQILSTPMVNGEIAVVETETRGLFAFSNPRLEELGPLQKQLLRMGRKNMRTIQAKAREILQQLGPIRVERPSSSRKP